MPDLRGRKPSIDRLEIGDPNGESLFSSADYTALIDSLRERSKTDISAMKLLSEMMAAERAAQAGNFVLNIVPFDILDRKLAEIVQQADVPVVEEILSGLSIRLEADQFSTEAKRALVAFQRVFLSESARIYAPPEE